MKPGEYLPLAGNACSQDWDVLLWCPLGHESGTGYFQFPAAAAAKLLQSCKSPLLNQYSTQNVQDLASQCGAVPDQYLAITKASLLKFFSGHSLYALLNIFIFLTNSFFPFGMHLW